MSRILQSHIVPKEVERIRLSDYAPGVFTEFIPSRKGIKKAIKRGAIHVDGAPAESGRWVKPGQKIELVEEDKNLPKPFSLPLEIVYEDDFLAVVNKPAGLVVSGNQFRTLQNALPTNLRTSSEKDALQQMRPVHRLDSLTSGLVLIAKTALACQELGRQFELKTVKKRYQTIVMGNIASEGNIQTPIDGKEAHTDFYRLYQVPSLRNEYLSLLDVFPQTGRTHQIRIHLSSIGHPILGDKLYGPPENTLKGKGMFLCATELNFLHPIHQDFIKVQIEVPEKYGKTLEREATRWRKYRV